MVAASKNEDDAETTNDERTAFFLYADEIDKKSKERENICIVEKIIKMKIQKGKKYFLVKWVGFPSSDNTWEPKEHLGEGACEFPDSLIVWRMTLF